MGLSKGQHSRDETIVGRSEQVDRRQQRIDYRKWLLLIIGVACVSSGIYINAVDRGEMGQRFASNSIMRIGIVLLALWLALPALKKPLSWLPPGIVAFCLVMVGVLAAQPKLIFVIAPAAGVALAFGGIARFFRRR